MSALADLREAVLAYLRAECLEALPDDIVVTVTSSRHGKLLQLKILEAQSRRGTPWAIPESRPPTGGTT